VRDTISFTEAGRVGRMAVRVDIAHTYIGDLRVQLTSPTGRVVTLHDRAGGSSANLHKTYDVADTPQLGALAGEPLAGQWTLAVADAAPVDTGRLDRWELEVTLAAQPAVDLQDTPGLRIPDDNATGIERTLSVTATGAIRDVSVGVDITHTYIGDLEISLIPPTGVAVGLHQRTGGNADNIVTSYTSADVAGLGALRGQPMAGPWRLKVADRERLDIGKLNRWSLQIQRQ
jgi:subtilisin-like proprotein convertase family protein